MMSLVFSGLSRALECNIYQDDKQKTARDIMTSLAQNFALERHGQSGLMQAQFRIKYKLKCI
jgi:hypothetical protein